MTNREKELEACLRDTKRELGYTLDALIELLPHQKQENLSDYALILARIRDLIKNIESLEE